MPQESEKALGQRLRGRAVFIHSRGSRWFLGHAAGCDEREVTAEEAEALVSAGFEIVQVDMKEGAPLCAALAAVPEHRAMRDPSTLLPQAAWTHLEP